MWRVRHVAQCLSSRPAGATEEDLAERAAARQRLWAGMDSAVAAPPAPPPQFNADARPQLHDAAGDPRSRVELLGPNKQQYIAEYQERGYVVCRNWLSPQQVAQAQDTIARIIHDWPSHTAREILDKPGPPFVDYDPRVVAGEVEPASPLLAVRRLFHLATNEQFFRRLIADDEDLLGFTTGVLGEDLKLVQSMALLKPPGTGEKRWHQDQGVFRLTPDSVLGWWVALDDTDVENGCMQMWPGSHRRGVVPHHLPVPPSPAAHIYYSAATVPPTTEAVAVPMKAGDALIFNVSCVHGSGPNLTDRRRWAIQMQYAPGHCRTTHCPEPGSAEAQSLGIGTVTRAVGDVYEQAERGGTTPDPLREVAWAPNPPPPPLSLQQQALQASSSGEFETNGRSLLPRGTAAGAPSSSFDCECVEPQFWSFRKAEMHICGRDDFGPDAI